MVLAITYAAAEEERFDLRAQTNGHGDDGNSEEENGPFSLAFFLFLGAYIWAHISGPTASGTATLDDIASS